MAASGESTSGGMWGGRFDAPPDELFRAVNDSLPFDWRFVREDVRGSVAWARGLGGAGVLSAEEVETIVAGLGRVLEQAEALDAPPLESGAEDVHGWVEAALIAEIGELGKKLHTGRSRNDQVATDFRLWTSAALTDRVREVVGLQRALLDLAERHAETPCPAFTHLQAAQPIVFGHWCVAYVEMLQRDAERMIDARERALVCPLGSAALAGTTFPVDRDAIAQELGFHSISANSLDGVSDRDFVIESLSAAALCAVHLSRMAEDLIIYASPGFGMVRFGDDVTSGSSLMPQKKNPDALELIRGKSARVVSAHATMLMVSKGLPLAYNKDLQEDKPALFGAMDELSFLLRLAALNVASTEVDAGACLELARVGHQNATELADYLVERGVAFRDAHDAVGRLVKLAIGEGVRLDELSLDQLRSVSPECDADVFEALTVEASLARRDVPGGTAPGRVRGAITAARERAESTLGRVEPD